MLHREALKTHKSVMKRKPLRDWCHLCGERSDTNVEIHFPKNAENDPPAGSGGACSYIRICAGCGGLIAAAGLDS